MSTSAVSRYTATTAREVTFGLKDDNNVVRSFRKMAAGTPVHVTARAGHQFLTVRIPGTLFTQLVTAASVTA